MTKKIKARHNAIKQLINSHPIEDQQTLVKLINEKYKIDANQSVISRDLIKLGITKNLINGKLIYEEKTIDPNREILRFAIQEILHNESMIIIKTLPGLASFVGDYLDTQNIIKIFGTIAGENTIFLAPVSVKNIELTYSKICQVLYFKK